MRKSAKMIADKRIVLFLFFNSQTLNMIHYHLISRVQYRVFSVTF